MEKDKELQVENGNYTRIVNKTLDELVKIPLLGVELSIVLFVIRKTWGYGKKTDKISLSQFQLGVGRSRPTVIKALKNLCLRKIIILVKVGSSINCGSEWMFNKRYSEWLVNISLPVNTPQLVKNSSSTSKEKLKKLVKTPLHTKDNTKETKEIYARTSLADVVIKKKIGRGFTKREDDNDPWTLQEFIASMRASPQPHMKFLAEYADEKKLDFKTKGQWRMFINRNVRAATRVSKYSEDQITSSFERMKKDLKTDKNRKGFITKWGIETIEKYLDQ